MIEYVGRVAVDMEIQNIDQFNGANTRCVRYTTTYGTANDVHVTVKYLRSRL